MTKRIIFITLLFVATLTDGFAQTDADISMAGTVQLDAGVAKYDYDIEISVTNHSFLVVSIFPFSFIRPVLSRVVETVTIAQGQSSANYSLNGISTNAVDYVIKFTCGNCDNVFDEQFYTANGNKFSAVNEVYIDPGDFPNSLNFTLQSGTSISGVISLNEGVSAKKNLQLGLTIRSTINPNIIFASSYSNVIAQGTNSVGYSIDGITRLSNGADFLVRLQCFNCLNNSVVSLDYPSPLMSSVEHSDIDFTLSFSNIDFMPSILLLLD